MGSLEVSLALTAQPSSLIPKMPTSLLNRVKPDGSEVQRNAPEKAKDDADESDTDAEPEQDSVLTKPDSSRRKRQQLAAFEAW